MCHPLFAAEDGYAVHRRAVLFSITFSFFLFSLLDAPASAQAQDRSPGNVAPALVADTPRTEIIRPNETIPEDKHVYRMNYWVSGTFSALASAANVYAIPNIIKAKKDLTDQELDALRPDIYNSFDRWALEQDPAQRDNFYQASDYTLPVIIAAAGVLGFDKNIRKDWLRIFTMYFEMHAVTFSLYNFSFFGPSFQNKYRPFVYYNYFPRDERKGGNQRNSQYSGHTATAAASTFFMVKVYSDYHPEIGNKKYLLYGLASIPPLVEGYLRMRALAHFPSDILIGYVIGASVGVIIPELHKFHPKNIHVGFNYAPGAPGLNLCWQPDYSIKRQPRGMDILKTK